MSVIVTPDQVRRSALGFTIPDDAAFDEALQALIDRAERMLYAEVPGLAERVTSGSIDSSLIGDEIVAMVLRVARNPLGKKSENIDDYAYSLSTAGDSGELYVSADARRRLGGSEVAGRAFGTIRIAVPAWRLP